MADKPRKNVCNKENSLLMPAVLCCKSQENILHAAVHDNDAAMFDYLVRNNVDLNCRNRFGETPLLMAIIRKRSPALIKRLLDLGCDINVTDEYGWTPLHVAIMNHNVEIVQKLIELGADLDVQDMHNRETPLFYAIKYNNMEVVCMLLCYGADVTIKNSENCTPLTYAMYYCRQDVILILLDYYDFNCRDNDSCTLLQLPIPINDADTEVIGVTKDGYCAFEFAMDLEEADVFKKIWDRMNADVVLETRYPLLLNYINNVWWCCNEWVECLYLMLESPIAIDLMGQCRVYCASLPMRKGFITQLLQGFQRRHVVSEDRQNIINICLTLGAEVTVSDLDAAMQLFGFEEELKTLIYATESYRSDDIRHPLLPLVIGLSDFNFVKTMWWCKDNIKATQFREEELVNNIIVSCLGFFSLIPFWKQELLEDCENSEYKLVGKIEAAREFPSLLELSRNRVHSLVREMRKAQKPYQFHDTLKSLPLPAAIIDLLLFKRPIYK